MERLGLHKCMDKVPEAGQRVTATVSTHNGEVVHEGLVLPPSSPKHITLKLDNGYNVSYPEADLVSIEMLDQPAVATRPAIPTVKAS